MPGVSAISTAMYSAELLASLRGDSLNLQPCGDSNLGSLIPGGETEFQVNSRLPGVTQKAVSSHSVTESPSIILYHLFRGAFLA